MDTANTGNMMCFGVILEIPRHCQSPTPGPGPQQNYWGACYTNLSFNKIGQNS